MENEGASFKGKKLGIIDLVVYQEGSVVSREILSGKGGTVTVFAFDAGQALSEHTAPFDAIVQVLDGTAEIRIAKVPFTLARGDMLIMPANVPHSVTARERFKMMLTMIRN